MTESREDKLLERVRVISIKMDNAPEITVDRSASDWHSDEVLLCTGEDGDGEATYIHNPSSAIDWFSELRLRVVSPEDCILCATLTLGERHSPTEGYSACSVGASKHLRAGHVDVLLIKIHPDTARVRGLLSLSVIVSEKQTSQTSP